MESKYAGPVAQLAWIHHKREKKLQQPAGIISTVTSS